jgi:hypothetical protein
MSDQNNEATFEPTPTPAPASAPPEQSEPIAAEQDEAIEETGDRPEKSKRGVGKRLNELTWQARQAERERDYWREQAMRSQYTPPPQPAYEAATPTDDSDPEYIVERVEARLRQNMERERLMEQRNTLAAKAESEGAYAFFNDVTLPVSKEIADIVVESDHSLALAGYLGENVDELRKIAALPPHKLGAAMAKLEARLSAPRSKPLSAAPAPGPNVSGRAAVRTPEAMSTDEWMRWRSTQLKTR